MSASGAPHPLPFATASPTANAPPHLTPQLSFLSPPGPFTPSLEQPPGRTPVYSPWPHGVIQSSHVNYWPPPAVPPTRPPLMHANSAPRNWTPSAQPSPGYLPLHVATQQGFGQGGSGGRTRQMSPPIHALGGARSNSVSLRNPQGTANVYIRLLPPHTRESDLFHLGSEFGQVRSVRVMFEDAVNSTNSTDSSPTPSRQDTSIELGSDSAEGVCKGCGFILFTSRDEASVAIRILNERGFEASFAKGDSPSLRLRQLSDTESTNLYLANLPVEYDEARVAKLLEGWAVVVSVRLLRQNDALPAGERGDRGQSKGIGFARVATREQALVVIEHLNNQTLAPATAPLKVRFADTPGQKQLKAELTAARERIPVGYKAPLSPISPRTSYFPVFPPPPTSPFTQQTQSPIQLSHMPGHLPARFLQERFTPPRRTSTLPNASATQTVAHKPHPPSTTARILRSSSLGLQLDIPPMPSSSVNEQDWDARPDSPPLTPRSAGATPSSGGSRRARGRGSGEVWSAGGMPRSAEPVKTAFSVEEVEGEGEVRDQVAGELKAVGRGGKRDMYAARKSLP